MRFAIWVGAVVLFENSKFKRDDSGIACDFHYLKET